MRGRSFRFWRRYALELLGVGLGAALFFMVISVLGAQPEALAGVFMSVPYYIMMGCSFAMVLCCFSIHISYVPLVLAMGSTRREAFWGFLLCRLAVVVVAVALSLLVWIFVPGDVARDGRKLLPLLSLILLLTASLGSLMGLLYQKWKGLGIVLLALVCGAVGGGCAMLVMSDSYSVPLFPSWMGPLGQWIAVGAVLWLLMAVADLLLTKKSLRCREVKL